MGSQFSEENGLGTLQWTKKKKKKKT